MMWQGNGCVKYREFLGQYFVSSLRTLKLPINLKLFLKYLGFSKAQYAQL